MGRFIQILGGPASGVRLPLGEHQKSPESVWVPVPGVGGELAKYWPRFDQVLSAEMVIYVWAEEPPTR